jgi:hypothetical protein
MFSAPDGREKPGLEKLFLLVCKERPIGSSFKNLVKKFFKEDL